MIDLPENEIREKHKAIGLVGLVNVLKGQNNQTFPENKGDFEVRKAIHGGTNITKTNVKEEKNDNFLNSNEDDSVNYKVGRLVMSILKEFKVATILQKFEKVLVENANISENEIDDTKASNAENSVIMSDLNRKVVEKKDSNYANHRGS